MDPRLVSQARARAGVVPASDLGQHPRRAARSAGLELLQPHAYLAATQPVDAAALVAAVDVSAAGRHAFLGRTALWLHGVAPPPDVVHVGVRHGTTLAVRPPARQQRVSADVLARVRVRHGLPVVDLEMAVIQAAAKQPHQDVVTLLEPLLRQRRTTIVRLRARCRRGLDGSAAVRRAVDELAGGSMEKAVRLLRRALAQRGVTGLRAEVRFTSAAGASCYADLLHEASRSLVEVDGFLSHVERSRFRADRRRDRWMRGEHGLTTFRVDVAEVWEDLEALADELTALLVPVVAAAS